MEIDSIIERLLTGETPEEVFLFESNDVEKLSLKVSDDKFTSESPNTVEFDVHHSDHGLIGKVIGDLVPDSRDILGKSSGGAKFRVDWAGITGSSKNFGTSLDSWHSKHKNSLGPRAIRHIYNLIKDHTGAEKVFSSSRVTGAGS